MVLQVAVMMVRPATFASKFRAPTSNPFASSARHQLMTLINTAEVFPHVHGGRLWLRSLYVMLGCQRYPHRHRDSPPGQLSVYAHARRSILFRRQCKLYYTFMNLSPREVVYGETGKHQGGNADAEGDVDVVRFFDGSVRPTSTPTRPPSPRSTYPDRPPRPPCESARETWPPRLVNVSTWFIQLSSANCIAASSALSRSGWSSICLKAPEEQAAGESEGRRVERVVSRHGLSGFLR